MSSEVIRVLVVDDSSVVRTMIRAQLGRSPQIQVVGQASDGQQAVEMIPKLRPDVVTLDVEMPRMNGLQVLEKFAGKIPCAFVMCSTLTQAGARITFEAIRKGAFDYVAKPDTQGLVSSVEFHAALTSKVLAAARSRGRVNKVLATGASAGEDSHAPSLPPNQSRGWVVAIGVSCGGPQTLARLLPMFPSDFVPIVVTQHMPPGFTASFARHLDDDCAMKVVEAGDGQALRQGMIFVAPGTHHLRIVRQGTQLITRLDDGPKVTGHRPAADVMFSSLASAAAGRCVGVILTGMGTDGTRGAQALRASGAWIVSQDRETSLVFGMPKSVYESGCVDHVDPLLRIPRRVADLLARGARTAAGVAG